jgi:hypothetical protein
MMPAAFRLLIHHHRKIAIAGHVWQEIEGCIGIVSGTEFLPEGRDILAARGKHAFHHPRDLAWIISARRMLSATFEWTAGDGLMSSRFSRTAAIGEAAMRRTAFGLLSSLLVGPPAVVTIAAGTRWAFEDIGGL